ncbi:MAG: DNA-3-methyladenine glycosylase [Phycisphaerales bacterium]|nr:DNA-3-methyladenine glycosylase [Phycisphaerales bacterium]
MAGRRCTKPFFARDADAVARDLLGCTLVRIHNGRRIAGRIVETEAYMGAADQASHARNNRRTLRTEPMFGPPGLSYVYFTYGMHFCMNVSCKAADDPAAVLLRALQPLEGIDDMRTLRAAKVKDIDLCRGPARLCRALAIGPELNGIDTLTSNELWFEQPAGGGSRLGKGESVATSARIGLGSKADEGGWTHKPLRFFLKGSAFVSGRTTPKAP